MNELGGSGIGTTLTPTQDQAVGQGNAGAVEVLEANGNRMLAIISIPSDAANGARVSDSNVDEDVGIPLATGDTIALPMKGPVYVCGEDGASTVAVSELLE